VSQNGYHTTTRGHVCDLIHFCVNMSKSFGDFVCCNGVSTENHIPVLLAKPRPTAQAQYHNDTFAHF